MKKIFTCFFFCLSVLFSFAQDTTSYIRKPSLGISFFFNDFTTAQRIRTSSLSSVLANDKAAKLKEMDPGFAITYFKGLREKMDLAVTVAASFVQYQVNDNINSNDRFLLETDASLNLKLLSEKYIFTPYANIGAGLSKYGGYYGAFIPLGLGVKLNIFDEAHIFVNSQYRIPVINGPSNYHFMHGIGIAGVIGNNK
jgi:OmpA-OmpF porin, OOP family